MRRFRYAKYAVTLLASIALTFHFLQTRIDIKGNKENHFPTPASYLWKKDLIPSSHGFTKSRSYLLRRLSQGNPVPTPPKSPLAPSWIVLPGNVTVHFGEESMSYGISYDIDAEKACHSSENASFKLLVFVASSVDHFAQRKAIRETWGLKLLQEAYNFRVVFLLGKGDEEIQNAVLHESFRYGDLVQINLTESFRNLGRKTVAGLQWTKSYCQNADFVMKTDDDILIHVPNLITALKNAKSPDDLLMCHENRMRKILRKDLLDQVSLPPSYHKYEVLENELPGHYYPPYCSGMAYVFSRRVRDRLLQASLTTPIFFIEDVYLTGFCRHKAGIDIIPHDGITLRPPVNVYQAACTFKDGRITSQEVDPEELRKLWAELNTQGFFCPRLVGYALKQPKQFGKSMT